MKNKNINEYFLDFQIAHKYAIEKLHSGNELAEYLALNLDFSRGNFFTLITQDTNLDRIYQFTEGGILPSSDEIIPIEGGYMKPIPNIDDEVSNYLYEFKTKKSETQLIFENVLFTVKDNDLEISGAKLISCNEHIYYLISQSVDKNVILDVLKDNNEIWYFLCLATSGLNNDIREFTTHDFKVILNHLSFMILGAYDGEGYIIWKKNNLSNHQ